MGQGRTGDRIGQRKEWDKEQQNGRVGIAGC